MRLSAILFLASSTTLLSLTSAAPTSGDLTTRGGHCDEKDPKCWSGPDCKDDCHKCDDDKCHIKGIDVTYETDDVHWKKYKFAYILATKGKDYKSPKRYDQYVECHNSGLDCGAYHVAEPTKCTGDDQAKWFISNGGDWQPHCKKLPGALSIGCEGQPKNCYGLSPKQIVDWIDDFSEYYFNHNGRYPTISTTREWWKHCTDNSSKFKDNNALWLVGEGGIADGWDLWSFLEYESPHNGKPGKLKWHSSYDALNDFAQLEWE
ncbi:hypothetical protein FRC03_001239 [Tulasnella sp. 419]|nr:hypothetical protein FRC03_001239 [Tulasnella sp. 419]